MIDFFEVMTRRRGDNPDRIQEFLGDGNDMSLFGSLDDTFHRLAIPALPVVDRIHEIVLDFVKARGVNPGNLLLGWETWLQLGWEVSGQKHVQEEKLFVGRIPIVVDDTTRQAIVPLPGFDDIELGKGRL